MITRADISNKGKLVEYGFCDTSDISLAWLGACIRWADFLKEFKNQVLNFKVHPTSTSSNSISAQIYAEQCCPSESRRLRAKYDTGVNSRGMQGSRVGSDVSWSYMTTRTTSPRGWKASLNLLCASLPRNEMHIRGPTLVRALSQDYVFR